MSVQKPLELILARNLLSTVSTPAFLVSEDGSLLFYNEAAGVLLGRSFDETGAMAADQWTAMFGPFGDDGKPVSYEDLPATAELRAGRPHHGTSRICAAGGHEDIAASAIPIVGSRGSSGAMVFFWPVSDRRESERTVKAGEESERA